MAAAMAAATSLVVLVALVPLGLVLACGGREVEGNESWAKDEDDVDSVGGISAVVAVSVGEGGKSGGRADSEFITDPYIFVVGCFCCIAGAVEGDGSESLGLDTDVVGVYVDVAEVAFRETIGCVGSFGNGRGAGLA
jgi:hypothetical protein